MPEAANFIDQLAEVSRRQGKPFVDPRIIQGFESGQPPPPPISDEDVKIPTAAEMFGGPPVEAEPVEGTLEASPLVAAGLGGLASPSVMEPAVPPGMKTDLLVMGRVAAYKERGVELSEAEEAAVARVVIRALKRLMKDQYREVEKLLPRRTRKRKVEAVEPKKRGRPKKVTQL